MNTIASTHMILLNKWMIPVSLSTFVPAVLSPEAIKALETSRDSLVANRNHDFHSLLVMTVLVAAGVILEGPEIVYKIWELFRRWGKGTTPAHDPAWITLLGLIGWLLVGIGVAGEFWTDGWVNTDDGNIATINEQLLRDAGSRASSAELAARRAAESAKTAHDESDAATTASKNALSIASGARKEADTFEQDIKSAKENSADASNKAASAESHLADALQRAANAEQETARLKGELADRTLTDAQVAKLAGELQKFAGQEFEITAYWDSPESLGFANRIYDSLHAALWKYNDAGQKSMLLGGVIGVKVFLHPAANPATQTAADLFIRALNGEGFACRKEFQNPTNNPKHNIISIIVGSKR